MSRAVPGRTGRQGLASSAAMASSGGTPRTSRTSSGIGPIWSGLGSRLVIVSAMTGPMTMNRVIHSAVRRDLARLESALAAASDGDTARAHQLQVAYANLHRQLKHHHEGEDTYVFPFLDKVEGASELVQIMESEHQSMADALDEAGAAIDAYASTGSASDAHTARDAVVRAHQVVERHLTTRRASWSRSCCRTWSRRSGRPSRSGCDPRPWPSRAALWRGFRTGCPRMPAPTSARRFLRRSPSCSVGWRGGRTTGTSRRPGSRRASPERRTDGRATR